MDSRSEDPYLDGLRHRLERAARTDRAWREARLVEVKEAAIHLGTFSGVTRVVLFGSLARGVAAPGSDVDLWVEGLAEEDWLDAIQRVRGIIRHAEVDIVRAEQADSAIEARVRAEGLVILEH